MMQSPVAVPAEISSLFDPAFAAPGLRAACDVRVYAPSWTAEITRSLSAPARAAKEFVLAAALCGLSCEEIAGDVRAAWPCLGSLRITAEADGARLVIDVD